MHKVPSYHKENTYESTISVKRNADTSVCSIISKHNKIASLTSPKGISIPEYMDVLKTDFSTGQPDTSASLDLRTSASRASWSRYHKIY